jgi:hypothetical protein
MMILRFPFSRLPDDGYDMSYMETDLLVERENILPDAVPSQYQAHFDSVPQLPEEDLLPVLPDDGFSWAMIELGVDEPLPPQEAIDELYIHFSFPRL